jgi:hypothetical protein
MEANTYISSDLTNYIKRYRTDEEMILSEQSMIAEAMCGIEIAISGMHVDKRTESLLKVAASVVSSYHWLLEMIRKEK